MKESLFIILMFSVSNFCMGQEKYLLTKKTEYDQHSNILNETIHHYENGKLVKTDYYTAGELNSYLITEYNSEGLKIKESYFVRNELSNYRMFSQNKKGKENEIKEFDATGMLINKKKYSYDSKGRVIKVIDVNIKTKLPGFYTTYKYSNSGKLLEEKDYTWPGILNSKLTFIYDKNDNLINKKQEAGDHVKDGKSSSKFEYKYGKLVKYTTCGSGFCDGTIYEYDAFENLVKETRFGLVFTEDSTKEVMGKYTTYEYIKN